jgi:hypothetical protein
LSAAWGWAEAHNGHAAARVADELIELRERYRGLARHFLASA